jgi:small subunit ribosomal protein S1
MKQLEDKPRSTSVRPDLTEGEVYKGTVVKLTGFGAFVKLDNGAEGLVHVSQISDKRIQSPDEVLAVGQEVKVKVLSVDPEKNRISLSIRDAELKEQRDQFEGYMKSASEDFAITIADRIRLKGDKKR